MYHEWVRVHCSAASMILKLNVAVTDTACHRHGLGKWWRYILMCMFWHGPAHGLQKQHTMRCSFWKWLKRRSTLRIMGSP